MKEEFLRFAFSSTPTRTYTNPSLYYLSCCICLPRGKLPLQLAAHPMPNPAFRRPLRRGCKTLKEPSAAQAQEFQSVDLRRVPTWVIRLLKPWCTAEANFGALYKDLPARSEKVLF